MLEALNILTMSNTLTNTILFLQLLYPIKFNHQSKPTSLNIPHTDAIKALEDKICYGKIYSLIREF